MLPRIISSITGLTIESFTISDAKDDLVIIKVTNPTKDTEKYNFAVIDITERKVVCEQAYLQNISMVKDKLESMNVSLPGKNGYDAVEIDDCKIYQGFQGAIIRIFEYKGVIWYTTYSKLTLKSRYGKSNRFQQLFEEYSRGKNFLDEKEVEKGTVLYFTLCHPDLQTISQEDIGHGRLILIRAKKDGKEVLVESEELQNMELPPLTLEEANDILLGGDDRNEFELEHNSGGYVYLIQGEVTIKVTSPAYEWRDKIKNNDPSIPHLVCCSMTDGTTKGRFGVSDEKFLEKYSNFEKIHVDEIKKVIAEKKFLRFHTSKQSIAEMSFYDRTYIIFMNLVLAVSQCQKQEVLDAYLEFFRSRSKVSRIIASIYTTNDTSCFDKLGAEDRERLSRSVTRYVQIVDQAKKTTGRGSVNHNYQMENLDNSRQIISMMVNSEVGGSLYHMIKLANLIDPVKS